MYALDAIADVLDGEVPRQRLMSTMESAMIASPDDWQRYYSGDAKELFIKRHFSYSDRIRYYWQLPSAQEAVSNLWRRLDGVALPEPLLHQYLPVALGAKNAYAAVLRAVHGVLLHYEAACEKSWATSA